MSAHRDQRLERAWLTEAARAGGAPTFAEQALLRLADGESAYGDRWAELSLARLIDELAEEAADLGAWGVLALQALRRDAPPDDPVGAAIASRLHGAILAGARAHRDLDQARADLHRLRRAAGRCVDCGGSYRAHPRLLCPATANRTEQA